MPTGGGSGILNPRARLGGNRPISPPWHPAWNLILAASRRAGRRTLFASALDTLGPIAYGGGGLAATCRLRQRRAITLKQLLKTIGLVSAVAVLMASAGAGATGAPLKRGIDVSKRGIDVSTPAAVKQYLRSIGVSPRGVVIQRGVRNYAGARCPGKRWTCTSTSDPVVQVAAPGGKNYFQCTSASCTVVQVAAAASTTNVARCIRTTGITQSCSITQSSTDADNQAIIVEIATKMSGLTQNASQTAQITQTATGGLSVANGNTACVLQRINVNAPTVAKREMPVTVTLEGHQSISIAQDSLYGANVVQNAAQDPAGVWQCDNGPLTQSQTLSSTATGTAAITQNQNAANNGPNLLLDIEQNQSQATPANSMGTNSAQSLQTSNLSATAFTPNGPVTQTQSSAGGGLDATVNQFSHGVSTSEATQRETQTERAQKSSSDASLPPNTNQTQYGPVHCCSVQEDNLNNTFTIVQSSMQSQNNTEGSQSNTVEADCSTTGNCTASQTTNVDGVESSNFQSGQNVSAEINCTGSDCTTTGEQSGNQLSVSDTDVGEFGFGGMRGDGTGSIAVEGVSGTVTKALLYWNGPTRNGPTNPPDPSANATVNFAGSPVTGVNIGFASDNCWGFEDSQSYRADVTPLVTEDGTYSLSNFRKSADVEINGVALIVFFNDGNTANDRNVVLWNGNDSNIESSFDPAGWDDTLTGVPYPGSGSASLDFVVSDGQIFEDDALILNGSVLVPTGAIFQGETTGGPFDAGGSLWDVKSFDMTSFLSAGSNDLHLTTGVAGDCLSLVVFAANVPASAPSPPAGASQQQSGAEVQATPAPALQSAPALPSAQRSGTHAQTAPSPLPGARTGGGFVQR
jgi:hypothetical protein